MTHEPSYERFVNKKMGTRFYQESAVYKIYIFYIEINNFINARI